MIQLVRVICIACLQRAPLSLEFTKMVSHPELRNLNSFSQATVAHAYNSSYLGGRDQEDRSLRAVQAKRENTQHKKGLVEWFKQ
jgi:hypothetical protein